MGRLAEIPVADDAKSRPNVNLVDEVARQGRCRTVGWATNKSMDGRRQQLHYLRHSCQPIESVGGQFVKIPVTTGCSE